MRTRKHNEVSLWCSLTRFISRLQVKWERNKRDTERIMESSGNSSFFFSSSLLLFLFELPSFAWLKHKLHVFAFSFSFSYNRHFISSPIRLDLAVLFCCCHFFGKFIQLNAGIPTCMHQPTWPETSFSRAFLAQKKKLPVVWDSKEYWTTKKKR